MSDWEFLYEMRDRGYSAEDIADAAACGYAPCEAKYIDREWAEEPLDGAPEDAASVQPSRSREGLVPLQEPTTPGNRRIGRSPESGVQWSIEGGEFK